MSQDFNPIPEETKEQRAFNLGFEMGILLYRMQKREQISGGFRLANLPRIQYLCKNKGYTLLEVHSVNEWWMKCTLITND